MKIRLVARYACGTSTLEPTSGAAGARRLTTISLENRERTHVAKPPRNESCEAVAEEGELS